MPPYFVAKPTNGWIFDTSQQLPETLPARQRFKAHADVSTRTRGYGPAAKATTERHALLAFDAAKAHGCDGRNGRLDPILKA
jgi:hypothetical protein